MDIDEEGKVILSLDLAQLQDYSAITVLKPMETRRPVTTDDDRDRRYGAVDVFTTYRVVWVERFNDRTYSQVLDRAERILDHPSLFLEEKEIVIDATGLGGPVVQMAQQRDFEDITPIVITGGESPRYAGGTYYVPRSQLITSLVAVVESERLKIAADLEFGEVLTDELKSLTIKKKRDTGRESFETLKSTSHDDLVMSLAMGIWICEQRSLQTRITEDQYQVEEDTGGTNWGSYGLKEFK